ncbi:hypothetical protein [Amnibacterium endophyticum]|uniref:Uncharacterized protein n=1 Tax=Amnibacterium endophyticum TaxID=2109337 RepID=A0ABW4LDS4_9MICO
MSRSAGVGVALVGLVLGVVALAVLPALPLPVAADLGGLGPVLRVPLAEIAGRLALLIPALLTAVGLLLPLRDDRLARLLPVGLGAPIAVFLVAQLNGVRDLGALVLTYAATAAVVLVRSLPGRRPWSFAAMLGIVPWGVIAFHQVGATIAGGDVRLGVRVLTVLVLAASIAEFVRDRGVDLRRVPVLVALPPALLAAGSLLV